MHELRVLTGQHQGAALPLFGDQWWIGAGDESDLVLSDPGIALRHARVYRTDDRWSVQAQDGLLLDSAGQPQAHLVDVGMNTFFAIGNVRLCITPVNVEVTPVSILPTPPGAKAFVHKRSLGILAGVILLAVALGLSFTRDPQASLMSAPGQAKARLESAYEVRQQLLKMLGERELSDRLALDIVNDQVVISGTANAEEVGLVSRMLNRFRDQFETQVAVLSRVSRQSNRLPFRIVQIVGGRSAHVVLEDGGRMFLGDEVEGVRLISIDNSKVVFDGQQRYEVGW